MKIFEIGLFSVICLCLVILAYYRFISPEAAKRRPEPIALDYARSFFPVLALVFVLRSFVAEPFRIPSGSMLSNLEVGDFILVNKYAYGIRLPILQNKVIETGEPDRGDIVVFRYPPEPDKNYIKRLIGLPGDTVTYDEDAKKLFINGTLVEKTPAGTYQAYGSKVESSKFMQTIERSDGTRVRFPILNAPAPPEGYKYIGRSSGTKSWKVPEGQYFMMGDNRDNSADGRAFGYVPDENVVGRAFFIWMHYGFDRSIKQNGTVVGEIPGDGLKLSRIGDNITAEDVD